MSPGHEPPAQQGVHVAGCPHCVVLHPELRPCPRCHGAARLVAAQMLDRDGVGRAMQRAAEAFDGSRTRLDELLQLLFVHCPASLEVLAEHGRVSLERLRDLDRVMAPDLFGLDQAAVRARLGEPMRRRRTEGEGVQHDEWHYEPDIAPTHRSTVHVLLFTDGRVVDQAVRRRRVDCDPLGPD